MASAEEVYEGIRVSGKPVNMVLCGCPHWSVQEVRDLASLLEGKRLPEGKRLWIGMSHQMIHLAEWGTRTSSSAQEAPLPAPAWPQFPIHLPVLDRFDVNLLETIQTGGFVSVNDDEVMVS
jgi:hypothetical protein